MYKHSRYLLQLEKNVQFVSGNVMFKLVRIAAATRRNFKKFVGTLRDRNEFGYSYKNNSYFVHLSMGFVAFFFFLRGGLSRSLIHYTLLSL